MGFAIQDGISLLELFRKFVQEDAKAQEDALSAIVDRKEPETGIPDWPEFLSPRLRKRTPRRTIGRERDLERVVEAVDGSGQAVITALHGAGGIGKTTLAMEFLRFSMKSRHVQGVWIINAENTATLIEEILALGALLGIERHDANQAAAENVLAAIADRGTPWVILYDNAPNRTALDAYLIESDQLRFLVTSRDTDWPDAEAIEIDVLPEEAAIKVLREESGRDIEFGTLARELDRLPLALVIAGAYLRKAKDVSVEDYLSMLSERLEDEGARDYPRSVGASISISIEGLSENAAGLLSLAAYLSPDDLWPEMIGNPDAYYDWNRGAHKWPEFLADVRRNPALLQDAITGLRQASLLREEGERLTLHRLTLAVMRAKLLDKENSENWADAAARLVNAYVPNDFDQPSEWDRYARLMPHIEALLPHAPASAASNRAFAQSGGYLHTRGDYPAAIRLLKRSVEISKKVNGDDSPLHATNLNSLAEALKLNGDWVEAELLYKQAIKIDERALGDHPQTATHINNLAALYVLQQRFADAEPLFLRAAEIDKTALGEGHPDHAIRLGNLGALYDGWAEQPGEAHRRAQAAKHKSQALEITSRAHGPLHQSTASFHNNMAVLHARQNDVQNARKEMLRAIAIRLELLGEGHSHTQDSLQSYAIIGGTLDKEALAKETAALRVEHAQWAVEKLQEIAARHGVEATDPDAIAEAVKAEAARLKAEGAPQQKWSWPLIELKGAVFGLEQAQKWLAGS